MGAWKDLFIFFGLIVLLFIVWVILGGPSNAPDRSLGVSSINSPSDSRGGDERRSTSNDGFFLEGDASPYQDLISFSGGSPQRRLVPEEYVRIRSSSSLENPVNITGWRIESVITGNYGTIPGATAFPAQGVVNSATPLMLGPSQTVVVNSGRSPLGVSFRDNQCVGYLDPRDRFDPRLSSQCPDPEREFETFGFPPAETRDEDYEDCREYIDRYIDRCEIDREEIDEKDEDIDLLPLPDQCVTFIREELTYPGCVANHRSDENFFENEWRVFLGAGAAELWREDDEILRLLDAQGRVVDVWQY